MSLEKTLVLLLDVHASVALRWRNIGYFRIETWRSHLASAFVEEVYRPERGAQLGHASRVLLGKTLVPMISSLARHFVHGTWFFFWSCFLLQLTSRVAAGGASCPHP